MTEYQTRDYDLVILILLIVFCWPAALIYYFTRPYVTRYTTQPQYQQYTPNMYCPQCGRPVTADTVFCPNCGKKISP